jgi:hypothetical protein
VGSRALQRSVAALSLSSGVTPKNGSALYSLRIRAEVSTVTAGLLASVMDQLLANSDAAAYAST